MPSGDCFRCHQPGHWANNCPLKTPTTTTTVASPPVIHCPCNGGVCNVLTSTTKKNPNRKFYTCSAVPRCNFFKWCDQENIKSEPISVLPTCPCGAGPCRRVTVINGPNAQRSYFVCCIKKGFGACGFFQWEDESQIQHESEEAGNGCSPCSASIGFSGFDSTDDENLLQETDLDSEGNVKKSKLGVVVESDLNSTGSNESTLGNRVAESVKDNADTLPMNTVTMAKKPIPVCSIFNNLKSVSADGIIVPSFDLLTLDEDTIRLETEGQVLPSIPPKHLEPQVDVLCSDHHSTNGKNESTSSGESEVSFSGSSSLMDLIEQYNSEKLHFETISMKYVDALAAYKDSYKQLESLRDTAHSIRKQLLEVEKQVKLHEAENSEFAASLHEVSGEMAKSQKRMVEMAGKVAKEVRVKEKDSVTM